MLRDITIGRYIKSDSALHRADPRTKAVCAIVFSVVIFLCDTLFAQLMALGFIAVAAVTAKIQLKYLIKGLKPLSWFLAFMFIINILTVDGNILLRSGILTVTDKGIYTAFLITLRFILFTLGTSVFTLTTAPVTLADGFASLIKPLKIFKVPTDSVAMIISVTLRLIPSVADEYERISKAQRARSSDTDSKGLISKIRTASACAIPLVVNTFIHSDELSVAMDARCYGKSDRKPRKKLKFTKTDVIISLIMILFCVFLAFIEFLH